MKTYLDRGPLQGEDFYFIEKPVWYSVSVDVPDELVSAAATVAKRYATLNAYLRSVYEDARNGNAEVVGVPPEIKEIIDSCHPAAPVEAEPAKKQKQKATAAASNSPSPTA